MTLLIAYSVESAKYMIKLAVVTCLGKQIWQGQFCPAADKPETLLDFPAPLTHRGRLDIIVLADTVISNSYQHLMC